MNSIIVFLYELDLGWLGMALFILSLLILLVASFWILALEMMKSDEDYRDEWRNL